MNSDADKAEAAAEDFYIEKNNCKKVLMAMLIGLKSDDGRKLGDVMEEPYSGFGQKTKFQPSSVEVKGEVKRRARQLGIKEPKPAYWAKTKCVRWLLDNPIKNKTDVAWLKMVEKEMYNALLAEAEE